MDAIIHSDVDNNNHLLAVDSINGIFSVLIKCTIIVCEITPSINQAVWKEV